MRLIACAIAILLCAVTVLTQGPAPPPNVRLAQALVSGGPLVGAFRHDNWDPNNLIANDGELTKLTTEARMRSRLPYHATVSTPAVVNENTRAAIDQDILYASNAGLDFWVIGHACSWGQYFYQGMKASQYRSRMKYALIETSPGRINPCRVQQLLVEIRDPQYLTVLGRPVVFIFLQYYVTDGLPSDIASLRADVLATVGRSPYLIGLDFTASSAASHASNFGLDAVSSYGGGLTCGQSGTSIPYSAQVSCEQGQWAQYRNTGVQYVPTVTTGWENILNRSFTTTEATPAEIANHLAQALAFHAANPGANLANLLLISAWNEYTENHYLVPNNPATNAVGAGRLNAVSAVLN